MKHKQLLLHYESEAPTWMPRFRYSYPFTQISPDVVAVTLGMVVRSLSMSWGMRHATLEEMVEAGHLVPTAQEAVEVEFAHHRIVHRQPTARQPTNNQ